MYGYLVANGATFDLVNIQMHPTGSTSISGCTFTSSNILNIDLDCDLSLISLSGNTYPADPFINVWSGLETYDRTLSPIDGLPYYMGNKSISSDRTLTVSPAVVIQGGGEFDVYGYLVANGATFDSVNIEVHSGGVVDLSSNIITGTLNFMDLSNSSHSLLCNTFSEQFYLIVSGDSNQVLTAEDNWWETTDPAEIEDRIVHAVDDAEKPLVDYTPFLEAPCVDDSVHLTRFEINQCFQEVEERTVQKYTLIETKPFAVRATLERYSAGHTTANAKLEISRSASGEKILELQENETISYGQSRPIDFVFNDDDTKDVKAGIYDFHLVVEDANSVILLDKTFSYEFKSSKMIRIFVVGAWNASYMDFIESVYPVPKTTVMGVNHIEVVPTPFMPLSNYAGSIVKLMLLHRHLSIEHLMAPSDFVICAIVPAGWIPGGLKGLQFGGTNIIIVEALKESKYVIGHEMGHVFGLGEEYVFTNPKEDGSDDLWEIDARYNFNTNPPPLELAEDGDFQITRWLSTYEGKKCREASDHSLHTYFEPISLNTDPPQSKIECFGNYIREGGYDVANNHRVLNTKLSMMSAFVNSPWISGPEYESLIEALVLSGNTGTAATSTLEAESLSSGGTRVVVSGIIDMPENSVELSPLVFASNLELTPESSEPNCVLAFLSEANDVLDTLDFLPLQGETSYNYLEGVFSVIVDLPAGTAAIQVLIDGAVMAETRLSSSSPTIEVLSPNGGENIIGQMNITWTASDADNNDLTYVVEYSHDGGSQWNILAVNHTEQELVVDSNYLPGGDNCLVKVTASDGWNESEDTSDAVFSLATKTPDISILDPANGKPLFYGNKMQGRCLVHDPETGYITDPNVIIWTSNIDSFLGKGNLISFNLSLGEHVLSVTATDPEGKNNIKTIEFEVVRDNDCTRRSWSDFNHDGSVDFFDLDEFADQWMQDCFEPDWCEKVDLNFSGSVDFVDFALFSKNWRWKKIIADLDYDCGVDFSDFAILAAQWLEAPGLPSADIAPLHNSDEIVDVLDLALFSEDWLERID